MAKKRYEEAKIAAIAEKIREKTGGTETYTTAQMPSGVDEVYDAGKKSEYDAFWDAFQMNGNRKNYSYAFASGWSDDTFAPKYDIRPTQMLRTFYATKIKNISQCIAKQGVVFDTSNCTDFQYAFSGTTAEIEVIPPISLVSVTNGNYVSYAFSYLYYCHTIEKLIVKEDGSTPFHIYMFNGSSALVNLIIEGTIGMAGFNVSPCTKLSKASITSIINALSSTTSGLIVTLSKTAVNKAFATTEGGTNGSTSDEWAALIATKTNWTITLS